MKSLFISLGILMLLLSSCETEDAATTNTEVGSVANGTLASISWIEGVWIDSTTLSFRVPPQQIIEEWTMYPDSLSGIGKSVKGMDTIVTERLTIRLVNDKLTYIARPVNRTMISFSNLIANDSVFIIENKVNEFPSKISYYKKGTSSLDIKMQGSHNSVPQELINNFVKG